MNNSCILDTKTDFLPISQWQTEDKPREKLLQRGKNSLSDAELIAILLGTGTQNETAVGLATKIMQKANFSLAQLAKLSIRELMEVKGIGPAKAITIYSALELSRRRKEEKAAKIYSIKHSGEAFEYMKNHFLDIEHEEFWIILLNKANRIIGKEKISQGGMDATITDVKIICKKAIEYKCSGLILCHNHPSGNKMASEADQKSTKKIKQALSYFDIKLFDHIIFCEQQYFSFADEGILP